MFQSPFSMRKRGIFCVMKYVQAHFEVTPKSAHHPSIAVINEMDHDDVHKTNVDSTISSWIYSFLSLPRTRLFHFGRWIQRQPTLTLLCYILAKRLRFSHRYNYSGNSLRCRHCTLHQHTQLYQCSAQCPLLLFGEGCI